MSSTSLHTLAVVTALVASASCLALSLSKLLGYARGVQPLYIIFAAIVLGIMAILLHRHSTKIELRERLMAMITNLPKCENRDRVLVWTRLAEYELFAMQLAEHKRLEPIIEAVTGLRRCSLANGDQDAVNSWMVSVRNAVDEMR